MKSMAADHIYVGVRKSDGSLRAMCCDDEGVESQTAEIVADWIKRGLSVERIPAAEYLQRLAASRPSQGTSSGGEK